LSYIIKNKRVAFKLLKTILNDFSQLVFYDVVDDLFKSRFCQVNYTLYLKMTTAATRKNDVQATVTPKPMATSK